MTAAGTEDSVATQNFRQARGLGALQVHVEQLEQQLELRGREIDALQVEAARRAKPWWREPATIIALVALAVSAVFSVLSRRDLSQADDQAKREKLTTLVQRLTAIQREVLATVRDSAKATGTESVDYYANVSSSLNTDRVMLARQAADLAETIPRLVTSVEFYAVAQELWQSGETTRALRMTAHAEENARNVQEYTAAVRQRALILFGLQRYPEGRAQMQRALDVFTARPEFNRENAPVQRTGILIDTQLKWGQLEFQVAGCEEVAHLDAAEKLIQTWRLPPTTPFAKQLSTLRKLVPASCAS
ncbi:hypothetical protein [Sphaerisporangium perillae]|uniref:hypothetical protein n=1 Tax=Sphaerisporangium perillae TaxID=2935860 RepID=UPI00200BC5B0|nr:hypothetical protein [Sphaerisporangium perillae]